MCGRFTLRASAGVVAEQFSLFELPPFTARFNIAPTQPVAVVRVAAPGAAGARELVWLRWGLIPGWAQDAAIGARMINARAETAAEKPAFRAAFRRRRCLVVADGFFEWQRIGRQKQPYFIRMKEDQPFAFAGLWESWTDPNGSEVPSCTLLTTEPNELMEPIHDRMPVILPESAYEHWLDRGVDQPEAFALLLRPFPADKMTAYPVSPHVNSPAHDDPRCIERAA
jgi:putative SOS response-associated peptidase YedK